MAKTTLQYHPCPNCKMILFRRACYANRFCRKCSYLKIGLKNRQKTYANGTRKKHAKIQHKKKSSMGMLGKNVSDETKKKLSDSHSGEKHWAWISDRTQVKKMRDHNDPVYKQWRKSVKNRDSWVCKISNSDCSGQIVAHHILPWKNYPELRYEVNNGITLCHFHHPRKRNDEMRLAPIFKGMVLSIAQ